MSRSRLTGDPALSASKTRSARRFGPLISNWNRYGSIDRRAKRIAMIVIIMTLVITLLIGVPWWALAAQVVVLTIVSTFILTRPETTD